MSCKYIMKQATFTKRDNWFPYKKTSNFTLTTGGGGGGGGGGAFGFN